MLLKKIPPVPKRAEASVFTDSARLLDLAIRIAAVAFVLDDILEYHNFIRGLNIFLPSPVLPILTILPPWSDWASLALHAGGLLLLTWRPRLQRAAVLVLAITTLCVLNNPVHLQPFSMMYAFTILMAALPRISEEQRLQALRVMIVGVYFWAGFNKLNTAFYSEVFPWFISPLWGYPPDHPFINFIVFNASLFVPVAELSIGIFLLFEGTRRLATVMAGCMLIVVLACLGPFGHNQAIPVWPWNIYLFALEFFLFLAPHENCLMSLRQSWPARIAAALFIIAPVLGIWNLWDAGPSFKLYSGNAFEASVLPDKREDLAHLPKEIRQNLATRTTYTTSDRVFRTGVRGLCPYLQYPTTAILQLRHPGEFDSLHASVTDEPLCPPAAQHTR